jgi:hypothetical protein
LTKALLAGATLEGHNDNRAILRIAPATTPSEQWTALLDAEIPVVEIRRIGSGLEDFYLSATEGQPKEAAA